jgi:hypothetical protein
LICVVDDQDKVTTYSQYPVPFLSAHDLIYITYKFHTTRRPILPTVSRNFSIFDVNSFQNDLLSKEWSGVFASGSIDHKCDTFTTNVLECINTHAPKRTRLLKRPPAPWLTKETRELMKERNKLRRAFVRSRNPTVLERYKSYRNKIKSLILESKRQYYSNALSGHTNTKDVWRELRRLGLLRKKEKAGTHNFSLDQFNDYFVNISSCNSDNSLCDISSVDPLTPVTENSFYFKHITPDTLHRYLRCSKSNSVAVDDIASVFLIRACDLLSPA